jgi:uncharacterized protein YjbJ (UPF0337 family)
LVTPLNELEEICDDVSGTLRCLMSRGQASLRCPPAPSAFGLRARLITQVGISSPALVSIPNNVGKTMNKDRINGAVEQAKGVVKEAVGKVTENIKLEVEGKIDKFAGKVQRAIGGVKDTLRR